MGAIWTWLHPRIRGGARLADAGGFGASLVAALLLARAHVPHLAGRLADRTWNARLFETIVQGQFVGDEKCGITQFYMFAITFAFVVAAGLVFGALLWAASRFGGKRGRAIGFAIDLVATLAVLQAARGVSRFAEQLALGTIALAVLVLGAHCGRGFAFARPSSDRTRAGIVVASEALSLAWMTWLLTNPQLGPITAAPALALLAAAGIRIGRARVAGDRALVRDALAGTPLLLLPFVGLLRNPSFAWVVAAVTATGLLRLALERRTPRLPEWLASTAGPTAVAAIFLLPLKFRELGEVSHRDHEGQHLGWLTSAMHGKLLFADAGFIYGPAREYLLGVIAWSMGGMQLGHVRLAHVFLNLAGVGLLLYVGWSAVHRRFWPFVLWWWLILARTPASFFLNYPDKFCFGWADDARAGVALLAMLLTLRASDALRLGERLDVRALRPLFGMGLLAAFSTLYSQDCGVAAIIATSIALSADAFLRRRSSTPTLRARLRRGALVLGAFGAGIAAGIGAFVLYYVARGRGHALVEMIHYEAVIGTGMSGPALSPLSLADFRSYDSLFAEIHDGWRLDYYVPMLAPILGALAVIASAARRAWTGRTSLLCALTLISCAMFRYGLLRADLWHMSAAAIPSYLLLCALVADAAAFRPRITLARTFRAPIGAAVFTWLALGAMGKMHKDQGLDQRATRVASGQEAPSTGAPYHYEDIPRAGDEFIQPGSVELVQYIRKNTKPSDPIWYVAEFISGGEFYFLSDRVDATPFDVWGEVVTTHDVERVMEALRTNPPVLIIGHGFNYTPESTAYVEAHWKLVTTIAGKKVRRYDPSSF